MINCLCTESVFVKVKDGILPEPETMYPLITDGAEAVQVYVVPDTGELNVDPSEDRPEQIVWEATGLTVGRGLTMILAVSKRPGHDLVPPVIARPIYNTVIGELVLLVNTCDGIVLLPESTAPLIPAGGVQVHEKLTPVVVELKLIIRLVSPEQIVCGDGLKLTTGTGFTYTIRVIGFPGHPFEVGVTR